VWKALLGKPMLGARRECECEGEVGQQKVVEDCQREK
jgi:hypothetical protein